MDLNSKLVVSYVNISNRDKSPHPRNEIITFPPSEHPLLVDPFVQHQLELYFSISLMPTKILAPEELRCDVAGVK